MKTLLKTAMFAAMALAAALPASAEISAPALTHDPLMKLIVRQLATPGGGLSGVTRLGSGQAIPLQIADPLAPLAPAEGLVEKPAKAKTARKPRRAVDELKKMSGDKHRADWNGRP